MHSSKVVYPPQRNYQNESGKVDVFLAGSIEMGKASDWQTMLGYILSREDSVGNVFNPRRADWDNSWEQSPQNPHFKEQVTWELDHIYAADLVFFNFVPGTMSPITLAEFGLVLGMNRQPIVCCPKDFWRSGNVEIMSIRSNASFYHNYEEAVEALISSIKATGFLKSSGVNV